MTTHIARTECSCSTCQGYCQHVPGWFLPGEMEQAAALFGMDVQEFFEKYITVDYWTGDDPIFTLRPRTEREPGGLESGFNSLGQCVFFVEGRCRIHAAKPHECATSKHDAVMPDGWHKATADAWIAKQEQITELLGRKPIETEPESFLEIFSMMFRR